MYSFFFAILPIGIKLLIFLTKELSWLLKIPPGAIALHLILSFAQYEAVYLVKKYDSEFPSKYFKEFLKYIDTSEKEFHQIVDSFRPPHLWKKVGSEWKLRHTVSKDGADDWKNISSNTG